MVNQFILLEIGWQGRMENEQSFVWHSCFPHSGI